MTGRFRPAGAAVSTAALVAAAAFALHQASAQSPAATPTPTFFSELGPASTRAPSTPAGAVETQPAEESPLAATATSAGEVRGIAETPAAEVGTLATSGRDDGGSGLPLAVTIGAVVAGLLLALAAPLAWSRLRQRASTER